MNLFRRRPDGRVLRIGHRGAAALAPENTIPSFDAAVRHGVDFVEFDVVELPDGELVVAHSLRELAAGAPTLEEALAFFTAEPNVGVHLDVKCRGRSRELVRSLSEHGLGDRAVVSSFRAQTLREVRKENPELPVALSYPDERFRFARRRAAAPFVAPGAALLAKALPRRLPRWLAATGASVAMLHYAVVSAAVIARCHARGAAVWAWTVNERALADRLAALGVDGIVSDDPRLLH